MSCQTQNIAIVKELYTLFAKRDIPSVLKLLSPDVTWGEPANPYNPAAGTRHGHAGFLEWLNIGKQSEDILVLEPKKFLVNDDSVAVVGFTKCLAKPTGRTYDTDLVYLIVVRDGKIVSFQEFFDTFVATEAFHK